MEFLTLSEKEIIAADSYNNLEKNHILILITDPNEEVGLPTTKYRRASLKVEFKDLEDFEVDGFNRCMARDILKFVNENLDEAEMIIVASKQGLGRASAVAGALSKIINHRDDEVFSQGIPNIFTYITILDTYFTEFKEENWTSIFYLRDKAMRENLTPLAYEIWKNKVKGIN